MATATHLPPTIAQPPQPPAPGRHRSSGGHLHAGVWPRPSRGGKHRRPRRTPADPAAPRRLARHRRRRRIRALANFLLAFAVGAAGFTAYQLWGTGVVTSRAQSALRDDVALHGFAEYSVASDPAPRPIPGGALGYIRIPRIGLNMIFVEGIDWDDLKKGPGHYPRTALPGQPGNVAIAGHRTTYLHPFWSLDDIRPGDRIVLRTRRGTFTYRVQWVKVVEPTAQWVVEPTGEPSVTLTTCNPRFSASQRLVVRGVLASKKG